MEVFEHFSCDKRVKKWFSPYGDKGFWVFGPIFLLENPNFGHFGSFLGDFGQNPCDLTAKVAVLGHFSVKSGHFGCFWRFLDTFPVTKWQKVVFALLGQGFLGFWTNFPIRKP